MEKPNIKNIFYKGIEVEKQNIIKTVNIDWLAHSHGIINICKSFEPEFEINENIKPVLKNLLLYFSGDEKSPLSLNKGIMLVGAVGTGKSLNYESFQRIYPRNFDDKLISLSYIARNN
jgi:SpoVK/Ycf46/Vps4 family AAA+-type ATPase